MSNDIISAVPIEAVVKTKNNDLIADALNNTEVDMVSSLGDTEILWMDSFLDQMPVFRTRDFSDAEYKQLTAQFLRELKRPTRTLIRLMCAFITNMDNIFEGKKERWFPEPLPNQKTVDISDVLDECLGVHSTEDKDRVVASIKHKTDTAAPVVMVLNEDETRFYNRISGSADRSRNTLAALSLGLLRIYARNPQNSLISNTSINEEWLRILAQYGYPSLALSEKRLDHIEHRMRLYPEDITSLIAMCLRRFHHSITMQSGAPFENPLQHSFIKSMSHRGLGLKRKYDHLIKEKRWSPSTLKSKVESLRDKLARKQLENYHEKMRYITWGLSGEAKLKSGEPFTTNFYMYSRVLNRRFFNSLDESRNKELMARLEMFSRS